MLFAGKFIIILRYPSCQQHGWCWYCKCLSFCCALLVECCYRNGDSFRHTDRAHTNCDCCFLWIYNFINFCCTLLIHAFFCMMLFYYGLWGIISLMEFEFHIYELFVIGMMSQGWCQIVFHVSSGTEKTDVHAYVGTICHGVLPCVAIPQ